MDVNINGKKQPFFSFIRLMKIEIIAGKIAYLANTGYEFCGSLLYTRIYMYQHDI